MGKLGNFLKDDGTNFIFTGSRLECYIPISYDNGKLYEMLPESIRVFGLFYIKVFDDKGKMMFKELLNVPTIVYMHPTDVVTENVSLGNIPEVDLGDEKYIVAKFYNNDVFMPVSVIQHLSNTELFLNLLCAGKLPRAKYSDILAIWQKNLEINKTDIGVTSVIQESIIKEIYRNPRKPELTFGETAAKDPSISEYDYRAANIREICARNSTFAAISFEDMDSMLTYSLNINSYNKSEKVSPVEEIIKM